MLDTRFWLKSLKNGDEESTQHKHPAGHLSLAVGAHHREPTSINDPHILIRVQNSLRSSRDA